eukprot:3410428-Pyramimonas_sp.AAC.1
MGGLKHLCKLRHTRELSAWNAREGQREGAGIGDGPPITKPYVSGRGEPASPRSTITVRFGVDAFPLSLSPPHRCPSAGHGASGSWSRRLAGAALKKPA